MLTVSFSQLLTLQACWQPVDFAILLWQPVDFASTVINKMPWLSARYGYVVMICPNKYVSWGFLPGLYMFIVQLILISIFDRSKSVEQPTGKGRAAQGLVCTFACAQQASCVFIEFELWKVLKGMSKNEIQNFQSMIPLIPLWRTPEENFQRAMSILQVVRREIELLDSTQLLDTTMAEWIRIGRALEILPKSPSRIDLECYWMLLV